MVVVVVVVVGQTSLILVEVLVLSYSSEINARYTGFPGSVYNTPIWLFNL